jgi:hypothetical protein
VIIVNNKQGSSGYAPGTAMQNIWQTGTVEKEEDTRSGYLRFNLNLIVDRPDGLIKEGNKNLSAGSYLDEFREIGCNKGHGIKFCRISLADDLLVKVV